MNIEEARRKSKEVWNEMAPGWHKRRAVMEQRSLHVAKWLVDRAGIVPGATILEIACGPGNLGFMAAERVGPEGRVIMTDFAPEMVEVARMQGKSLGIENVEYRVMDAERMDLPDASLDAVMCRWAYMLMMDPAAAFSETHRVLRPRGRLAFSVWGPAFRNPWATVPAMALIQLGLVELSDPNAPGGVFSLGEEARIRELVEGAGFTIDEIEPIDVTWKWTSFDEAWDHVSETSGSLSQQLGKLSEEGVAEVKAAIREASQSFESNGAYLFPGVTINVSATR